MLSPLQTSQLSRLETADITNSDFITRYKQAVFFVLPTIEKLAQGRKDFRVLEVGCGKGAKLCALAPSVADYVGIELDGQEVNAASANANKLGLTNVQILHIEANQIDTLLSGSKFSLIMLYAVLEHLTLEERHSLLSKLWDALAPDAYIYIGETPNLLSPIDYHSSNLPYFHMLPSAQKKQVYNLSRRESWKSRVASEQDLELGFWRNGAHVSFYDFMLSIMPLYKLEKHIIYDNFEVSQLSMNPFRWHEANLLAEIAGHFDDRRLETKWKIPRCFSRYWIDFVLSKTPAEQTYGPYPSVGAVNPQQPGQGLDPFRNPIVKLDQQMPEATYLNRQVSAVRVIVGLLKKASQGSIELSSTGPMAVVHIDLDEVRLQYDYWNPIMYFEANVMVGQGEPLCLRVMQNSAAAVSSVLFFP